ncbi:retrovirus-related Pol polyprotein from transposon 412 [Trichonephila clavipes]|nr:retrovirus-related Pol polyprotein from transposon 412 [Trichonephila clavipes]
MAVQLEVIMVLCTPFKKFVSTSAGTMYGVTWKSVVTYVTPVLHVKVPENALEADCSGIMWERLSNDWDKKLPFFLLAYKSAVHETTGYSPSQMFFGRDRLPADPLFSQSPDAPLAPVAWMEEMHHLARERIGLTSEKMKTRNDSRATTNEGKSNEGDKMGLWNPKRRKVFSPKLQTNWEGSSTVL